MKSPYQVEKELKNKILKPEYTFEYFHDIKGETITQVFDAKMESYNSLMLPAIIFVSDNEKVFIHCLGIDETLLEEEDVPEVEAIERTHVNKHRLLNMILDGQLKLEGMFAKEKLPFFDQDALKVYEDYKRTKRKKEEEQYRLEQEYKRYKELKNKFEGN